MYYYIHWTRLLCTGLIPFSFLAVTNILIYRGLRHSNLRRSERQRRSSVVSRRARGLSVIMIVIGTLELRSVSQLIIQ